MIVDWAPWHHTAGGNHDVGLVLYNGGTLYIDGGKPLPGAIDETVRNLREIAPTWYFNGAEGLRGAAAVLPRRRGSARKLFRLKDALVRRRGPFAARVRRVEGDAQPHLRRGILSSRPGLDRDRAFAFGRMWHRERRTIGLPPPGLEVKLVPLERQDEARLSGPNITPGYWREPKLTAGL